MKITKIEGNVKSPGSDWSVDINDGVNVICVSGPSGGGKTALLNAAQLCLLKSCWVDILGKEVRQGKMIRGRLNGGKDLWAKVHHSKGVGVSSVAIVANDRGSVPSNWHTGWKAPHGANLASTLKDILARTPAKMTDMLVDLVVSDITHKDIKSHLTQDSLQWYEIFEARKLSPLAALNGSIEEAKSRIAGCKKAMDPLLLSATPVVVAPSAKRVANVRGSRDFWASTLSAINNAATRKNSDAKLNQLNRELEQAKADLEEAMGRRDAIVPVDIGKLEAYESARALALYAGEQQLSHCPLCASQEHSYKKLKTSMWSTKSFNKETFEAIASGFEVMAERIRSSPLAREAEVAEGLVTDALSQVERLERLITFTGGSYSNKDVPEGITYAHALKSKEEADATYDRVMLTLRRHELAQEAKLKLDKITSEAAHLSERKRELLRAKSVLVDVRFGEFLELARTFMPDPQHLKGGVLHVDIGRREVGFVRNGELHLDPSGSELRTIVIAMALAAGSRMAEPPPIFIDDVGWGDELLCAAMNAWTRYSPGMVFVPTTSRPARSRLRRGVQVVTIEDSDVPHLTTQAKPLSVQHITSGGAWMDAPRKLSFMSKPFALAIKRLKPHDTVVLCQPIKDGRRWVEQKFLCDVTGSEAPWVTLVSKAGVSYSVDVREGQTLAGARIAALPEAVVLSVMHKLLASLGYTPDYLRAISLAEAQVIWQNQTPAED